MKWWNVTHEPAAAEPREIALMGRRMLALVLAVAVAACGWRVRGPKRLEAPPGGRRVADRVILVANDGGVVWGGGRLGEVVRDTFVASGAFGEVYFPAFRSA